MPLEVSFLHFLHPHSLFFLSFKVSLTLQMCCTHSDLFVRLHCETRFPVYQSDSLFDTKTSLSLPVSFLTKQGSLSQKLKIWDRCQYTPPESHLWLSGLTRVYMVYKLFVLFWYMESVKMNEWKLFCVVFFKFGEAKLQKICKKNNQQPHSQRCTSGSSRSVGRAFVYEPQG